MDIERFQSELVTDEGVVCHAYQDSLGLLTIGVGRLIDARKNGGISHAEAMFLLANDIKRLEAELESSIPCWHRLDDVRQRALANLAFQLGIHGVLKFHHMLAALAAQSWQVAHDECLNSRYAQQTPARARRIARMLLTGQMP